MSDKTEPRISPSKDDYTQITFKPDLTKFGMSTIDDDFEALVRKRVHDMAGCCPGVKVRCATCKEGRGKGRGRRRGERGEGEWERGEGLVRAARQGALCLIPTPTRLSARGPGDVQRRAHQDQKLQRVRRPLPRFSDDARTCDSRGQCVRSSLPRPVNAPAHGRVGWGATFRLSTTAGRLPSPFPTASLRRSASSTASAPTRAAHTSPTSPTKWYGPLLTHRPPHRFWRAGYPDTRRHACVCTHRRRR